MAWYEPKDPDFGPTLARICPEMLTLLEGEIAAGNNPYRLSDDPMGMVEMMGGQPWLHVDVALSATHDALPPGVTYEEDTNDDGFKTQRYVCERHRQSIGEWFGGGLRLY